MENLEKELAGGVLIFVQKRINHLKKNLMRKEKEKGVVRGSKRDQEMVFKGEVGCEEIGKEEQKEVPALKEEVDDVEGKDCLIG